MRSVSSISGCKSRKLIKAICEQVGTTKRAAYDEETEVALRRPGRPAITERYFSAALRELMGRVAGE